MSQYLAERANLAGKTAAVLGGASGIGAAVSLALARSGVDVAIFDIDEAGAAETQRSIEALGPRACVMVGNVANEKDVDAFYDTLEAKFSRLDIVVNLAGGTMRRPLLETTRADIAADVSRNYLYVVQSVQRAIPLIRRTGEGGSIINFTTIEAHRGAATFSVYAGAKAATTNFSRSMAVELGKDKIRVNCIAPDTTPSQGNFAAMPPEFAEGFMRLPEEVRPKGMAMYIPRGEQPPAEALADAVLFLASDLSTFISGTTLHVDGGTMAAGGFLDWPFGDGFVPVPLAGTLGRMFREGDQQ